MNKRQPFKSEKLLEGLDLPEGQVFELTIAEVIEANTMKDSTDRTINKTTLVFKEGTKNHMILSKGSESIIRSQYGNDHADWISKTVRIQRRYLKEAFGCPNCICLRILPPKGAGIKFSAWRHMGSPTPYEVSKEIA